MDSLLTSTAPPAVSRARTILVGRLGELVGEYRHLEAEIGAGPAFPVTATRFAERMSQDRLAALLAAAVADRADRPDDDRAGDDRSSLVEGNAR
jgi:hypothetical protein